MPALLLLSLLGCVTQQQGTHPVQEFSGPTLPMAEVVRRINANNEKLPTLWATHNYLANVLDDRKRPHRVYGTGAMLYQNPRSLRLVGQKEFVGTIFEVGSNDTQYWLRITPELNTIWWGNYADFDRADAAGGLPIPIRPDLVVQVLGIATINTNFLEPPSPVMRFDRAADAYDFLWVTRGPDRLLAKKEIWYDRQTLRHRACSCTIPTAGWCCGQRCRNIGRCRCPISLRRNGPGCRAITNCFFRIPAQTWNSRSRTCGSNQPTAESPTPAASGCLISKAAGSAVIQIGGNGGV